MIQELIVLLIFSPIVIAQYVGLYLGVVTAFCGAPFFMVLLRTRRATV